MRIPRAIPTLTESAKGRFWSKINKGGPTPPHCPELGPCWIWTGWRHKQGYGLLGFGKSRNYFAHRIAYVIHHGAIPDGLHVLHACDNPPCCNPAHLFAGTHTDNMDDMTRKGRTIRSFGEQHGGHKLSSAQVAEIRARYIEGGLSTPLLAKDYGVCRGAIKAVVSCKIWLSTLTPEMEARLAAARKRKRYINRPKGIESKMAVFNEDQVRRIRLLYATGNYSQKELAVEFSTTQANISLITMRKNWKHI